MLLKVVCDNLKVYIGNPRKNIKKNKKNEL